MSGTIEPGAIGRALAQLDQLATGASALATASLPHRFGRAGAMRTLVETARELDVLASDTGRALDRLGLDQDVSAPIWDAVRATTDTIPQSIDHVARGRELLTAVDEARTRMRSIVVEHVDDGLRDLLTTPPRDWADDDVRVLRSLLQARDTVDGAGIGRIATEIADSDALVSDLERIRTFGPVHLELAGATPEQIVARIGELVDIAPAALGRQDAEELRLLLRTAHDAGASNHVPHRIGGVTAPDLLERIAAATDTDVDRRMWDVFRATARGEQVDVAARLRPLLETPVTEATPRVLDEVGMLRKHPDAASLGLAGELDHHASASKILRDEAERQGSQASALQDYFDAWRLHLDGVATDPDRLRAAIESYVTRPPDTLTPADWSQLRALLAIDGAGGQLNLARDLPGAVKLDRVLDSLADGSRQPGSNIARYLETWRMQLDPAASDPSIVRGAFGRAVDMDPTTFDQTTWTRLQVLLDADVAAGSPSGLAHRLSGIGDASEVLGRLAGGTHAGHELDRFRNVWRLQLDDTLGQLDETTLRTELDALVHLEPDRLDADAAGRLLALTDLAHVTGDIKLAHALPGADRSGKVLGKLAAGRSDVSADAVDRYLHVWRAQLAGDADPDAIRAEVDAIVQKGLGEFTSDDWRRLRTLVDLEQGTGAIDLVTGLRGVDDLGSLLTAAVAEPRPSHDLRRFLNVWRMQLGNTKPSIQSLREELGDILQKPDDMISRDEWRRAQAIVDLDGIVGDLGISTDGGIGGAINAGMRGRVPDAAYALGQVRAELERGYAVPEAVASKDGHLRDGHVRRSDVDAFLAQSKLRHTVFHGSTNHETYEHIARYGARIGKNKRSAYGRGVYNAFTPGGWGRDIVELAVDTRNPFVGTSGQVSAAGGTSALRSRGYDAVIMRNGSGGTDGDWLITLRDDNVKVVVEDFPGARDHRPASPSHYHG